MSTPHFDHFGGRFPFFSENISSLGLETNHQPVQLTKGRDYEVIASVKESGIEVQSLLRISAGRFGPPMGLSGCSFFAAKMWSSERATKIVAENQQTNANIELNYIPDGPCREYLPTFPLAIFHPNVGE